MAAYGATLEGGVREVARADSETSSAWSLSPGRYARLVDKL